MSYFIENNNDGYTIDQMIRDRPYNDIQPWHYHKLVDVFGGEPGLDGRTERERVVTGVMTQDLIQAI